MISEATYNMSLVALQHAGIVTLAAKEDGIEVTPVRDQEPPEPTPTLVPSYMNVHGGNRGPLAWVMRGPAPYDGLEVQCSPDESAEVGIRCMATYRPNPATHIEYAVEFTELRRKR
jgi:hypothetical protein